MSWFVSVGTPNAPKRPLAPRARARSLLREFFRSQRLCAEDEKDRSEASDGGARRCQVRSLDWQACVGGDPPLAPIAGQSDGIAQGFEPGIGTDSC